MQVATPASDPLILTLSLDEASFRFFNEQRKKYFPPERNFLAAHLTLFHHLPPDDDTIAAVAEAARAVEAPLPLAVTGLMRLGGGVAYRIENPALIQLHQALQQSFLPYLKPQDRQPLRPHITVQNKVRPANAEKLYLQLSSSFKPFVASGTGLTLWAYKGGPWQWLHQAYFGAQH